ELVVREHLGCDGKVGVVHADACGAVRRDEDGARHERSSRVVRLASTNTRRGALLQAATKSASLRAWARFSATPSWFLVHHRWHEPTLPRVERVLCLQLLRGWQCGCLR